MRTRGYMVLTLVFIVSAVALALGLSLKLQSIAETDIIRRTYNATNNFVAGQSCLEEALRRLKLGAYTGGALTLGATACAITTSGTPASTVNIIATQESLIKRLRGGIFTTKFRMFLSSWQELP